MDQDNKPSTCPLCRQSNGCAMAAGSAGPCWCMAAGEPGALAAAIPPGLPGEQCVCAACARRLLAGAPAGQPVAS